MSVRHALLALLSEGPKYGLQLRQEFEARTGEVWPLNTARCTRRCSASSATGSSSPTSRRRRAAEGLPASPPPGATSCASGCARRRTRRRRRATSWSSRCSWRCGCPASTSSSWCRSHRRHLVEMMRYYTRLKEDAGDDDMGLLLVADAELFRLDGVVRWLDAADARIKRLPAARRGAPALAAWPQAAPPGRGAAMRARSSCGRCRSRTATAPRSVDALRTST